jgi:hypothetical protein
MKDKPNVSWDQVIGLVDAKRAIRESIFESGFDYGKEIQSQNANNADVNSRMKTN